MLENMHQSLTFNTCVYNHVVLGPSIDRVSCPCIQHCLMWCELGGVTVELLLTFRSTSPLQLLIAHFVVETSLGSLDAGFKHFHRLPFASSICNHVNTQWCFLYSMKRTVRWPDRSKTSQASTIRRPALMVNMSVCIHKKSRLHP